MANKQELAIYESRVYTPELFEEQIERFLKRPDEFTVQRFRIAGLNRSIHDLYSSVLFNDGKQRSIVELATPIAKMIFKLPSYTQTTRVGLSARAQAVRNAFGLSKSPIELMLEELPKALDVHLDTVRDNKGELKKLSKRMIDVVNELKSCLPNLKCQFRELLAQAFSQDKEIELVDLREAVAGRCRGLDDYTIDRDVLTFIERALKSTGDPERWLDELLSYLGKKPIDKWNDTERDAVEYRLTELTRKLSELERLRLHYQDYATKTDGDFDVYLLRSVKKGQPDYDEVVAIDKRRHDAIKTIKENLLNALNDAADGELKMAALAELVDEVLAERRETTKSKPVAKANRMRRAN